MKTHPFFFGCIFLISFPILGQDPGDLDTSFSVGGIDLYNTDNDTDDYGHAVIIQSDGKILSIGDSDDFSVVRYLPNGDNDSSFGDDSQLLIPVGVGSNGPYDAAQQTDGKIILVGGARPVTGGDFDFALVRINPNGTLDSSFGDSGFVFTDFEDNDSARAIAIQGDAKIVAAGSADTGDSAIARYLPDGSLDPSFGDSGKVSVFPGSANNGISDLVIQPDNKIVFISFNSVVRLNPDGSFDTSFGDNGIVIIEPASGSFSLRSIEIQQNEKLIMAGSALDGTPNNDALIVRLNTDGTLDTSFDEDGILIDDISAGLRESVFDILLQPDRKIIIGGRSGEDFLLARYRTNGSRDTTFGNDGFVTTNVSQSSSEVGALTFQGDGKIVMVGDTFTPIGTYSLVTARYHRGVLAIDDIESSYSMNLYPNPLMKEAILDFQWRQDQSLSIYVYDLYGRKVSTVMKDKNLGIGNHKIPIRIDELSSGNYLLVLESENVNSALKFIKE